MKKNLFFALAASALVLTACSNREDEPFGGARPEGHPVEITFDLAVNSGIESRTARELWSSEALQSVEYVDIYVFGTDNTFKQKLSTKDNTTLTPTGGTTFASTGEKSTESHTYRFVTDLKAGDYKFVAIGFEADPAGTYSLPTLTPGVTKIDDIVLTLDANNAVEVFMGFSQATVSDKATSLNASITLNRAVAGVLAYFQHIPYTVAVEEGQNEQITRVAVRMAGKGTKVKAPAATNGVASATNDNVTNPYELISFSMKGLNKDGDNNWYAINSWKPEGAYAPVDETKISKVQNSVLGGRFVLPFDRSTEVNTIEVVLFYEKEGVEKEAKVYGVYCTQEDTKDNSTSISTTNMIFPIVANHFYGLGQKYQNNTNQKPNPDEDPDNPNPDKDPDPDKPTPDEPIDLSAVEYITVTVKAAWNTIHHLGFDL